MTFQEFNDFMAQALVSVRFREQLAFVQEKIDTGLGLNEVYHAFNERYEKITICEAQVLDYICLGKGGAYWRKAYGLPLEGDVLDEFGHVAISVGIFSFDISCN